MLQEKWRAPEKAGSIQGRQELRVHKARFGARAKAVVKNRFRLR